MLMAMMDLRYMGMIVDERQVVVKMAVWLLSTAVVVVGMMFIIMNVEVVMLDPVVVMEMTVMRTHK